MVLGANLLAGCASTVPQASPTAGAPAEVAVQLPGAEFGFADAGDGRAVHYVATGDKNARAVVFVHGTPGNWQAYANFLAEPALASRARLVAIDRLGFGKSTPGEVEPSLEKQATSVVALLRALAAPGKPLLVGHSYGGPVIAKIAMDHPELVGGLVMVAPSIDPELERLRWYNHLASWRLLNWALPRDWLVSNREILPLKKELLALAGDWNKIVAPLVLIQGEDDRLVPAANADFAARQLPAAQLRIERIPAAGHFVLWQQPHLVVEAILSLLDRDNAPMG